MSETLKNKFPFASLDFLPGRRALTIAEIAQRLSVSPKHIYALIEEGKLTAINITSQAASDRKYWRITIESYREFILLNLSNHPGDSLVQTMSVDALVELHREITSRLEEEGVTYA